MYCPKYYFKENEQAAYKVLSNAVVKVTIADEKSYIVETDCGETETEIINDEGLEMPESFFGKVMGEVGKALFCGKPPVFPSRPII